jgi:hypothetical protein
MREQLGFLLLGLGFVSACGAVESSVDAPPGTIDAPPGTIDAPEGTIDAPEGTIDAPMTIDAPAGPPPVLYWTMEGNVNNSGSLSGYTLTTPAGITYVTGKFGQAANYAIGQYAYTDGARASLGTYADVTIGMWMKEPGSVQGTAFLDCNNRQTAPYGGVQMGLTSSMVSVCVSTTTNSFLSGSCNGFTAPTPNVWHHWLVRYDGTGTGTGQGGVTEIYVDDVLVHTRANDGSNNPVFSPTGILDRFYVGGAGNTQVDDVRVYNQVFSRQDQCTFVMRGTWTGSSCTPP